MKRRRRPQWGGPRPDAPDPAVLRAAALGMADVLAREDLATTAWDIENRWDRRRSTVFLMRPDGDRTLSAYYKQSLLPMTASEQLDDTRMAEIRAQLDRSVALSRDLAILCRDEPVEVAQTLAVEEERLIEVTLAIEGSPIGKMTSARTQRGLSETLRVIGRGARLIESASSSDGSQPVAWNQLERALRRSGGWLSPGDRRRVLDLTEELHERLVSEGWPVAHVHGDLSHGNILRGEDSIGLIDFKWVRRYVGFDLAYFSFREMSPWALLTRRSPMTDRLLEGYGDDSFAASTPWRFHRIQFLVRLLGGNLRHLTRAPGARRQIARLLSDS